MISSILAFVALGLQQSPSAEQKLEVKDLKVGAGRQARAGDLLTMEYKGTLANGTVFDENVGKVPFSFKLGTGQVIKGWDQGMVGIRVGGKRRLTIPADLGYDAAGAPPDIPANSTLVFEVQCFGILPPDPKPKITIKEIKTGTGAAVKDGDAIELNYKGCFLNGVKFDSSYDRKQPLSFTLGKMSLIPGFVQGVTGMKVGEKRKVTIPPQLAYGERGRTGIGRNATLVFELELMSKK